MQYTNTVHHISTECAKKLAFKTVLFIFIIETAYVEHGYY